MVAGASAEMFVRGGTSWVADASGMSRNTVIKAEGEVIAGIAPRVRLRAPGAGAKRLTRMLSEPQRGSCCVLPGDVPS